MSRAPVRGVAVGLALVAVVLTLWARRPLPEAAPVEGDVAGTEAGAAGAAGATGATGAAEAVESPEAVGTSEAVEAAERSGGASWEDADWSVFQDRVQWARRQGIDTLPLGEALAAVGRTFVGTAYVPRTLEAAGPEALVINFRGLDCVTFVENALALARFARDPEAAGLMQDRARAEARYEDLLTQHRYRDGVVDGYASRLHYFTDWVRDNQARGLVEDVSQALGGVRDAEPIDFMTTHPEAYRQLSAAENLAGVRAAEERLSRLGRFFIEAGRIAEASPAIRNGDIIAATSTVQGLDVAHTGLALWVDGELRLLHAPLVGEEVTISEVSLADRLRAIAGQDGIIVARPVER